MPFLSPVDECFLVFLTSYRIKLDRSLKHQKTPFIFVYLLLVYKYNKYLFLPFRQKFSLINKNRLLFLLCKYSGLEFGIINTKLTLVCLLYVF